ncbi:hypothetical protein [Methylibium sp.]
MKPHSGGRWGRALPLVLMAGVCAAVFAAWLTPRDIAVWLRLWSFCG